MQILDVLLLLLLLGDGLKFVFWDIRYLFVSFVTDSLNLDTPSMVKLFFGR